MNCAWQAYLSLVPVWLRKSVDKHGKDSLLELRLRLNLPAELVTQNGSVWLDQKVKSEDLRFCVNVASKYSPWAAKTVSFGYITAPGGHRIGLCGSVTSDCKTISGIHDLTSICIRVSRDFPGIAMDSAKITDSVLIIGKPGSGKTTFLRDFIRQLSNSGSETVCVVDEKEEIFPRVQGEFCYPRGDKTDILSSCDKAYGIEMSLRNMTPSVIAVDEITAKEDCDALLHAGWCGVRLIATAHAGDLNDFLTRPIYRSVIESKLFPTIIVLHHDKTWHIERLTI